MSENGNRQFVPPQSSESGAAVLKAATALLRMRSVATLASLTSEQPTGSNVFRFGVDLQASVKAAISVSEEYTRAIIQYQHVDVPARPAYSHLSTDALPIVSSSHFESQFL